MTPPASLEWVEQMPVPDSQQTEAGDIQTMLQELLDSAPGRTLGAPTRLKGLTSETSGPTSKR